MARQRWEIVRTSPEGDEVLFHMSSVNVIAAVWRRLKELAPTGVTYELRPRAVEQEVQ